jgi:hypothetical protein
MMNREDAGDLRERLAGIRSRGFLSPRMLRTESRVVARIVALTGLSAEEVRAAADEDAEAL